MRYLFALGAAIMAATPAAANLTDYQTFPNWKVMSDDHDCTLVGGFTDDTELAMDYEYGGDSIHLRFTSNNGATIRDGSTRDMSIYLLRPNGSIDAGWGTKTFRVAHPANQTLFMVNLDHQILTDIAQDTKIGFFYNGKPVDAFPLNGTAEAISSLRRCAFMVARRNGSTSADPFA